MISECHREKKSWVLKALSLFVIITFLFTQTDVQLAFGNGPAANALPATSLPDLQKSDKIHYMQDLKDLQKNLQEKTGENPINEVKANKPDQQNPFVGDIPKSPVPEISTSFLKGEKLNPLMNAAEKQIVEENPAPDADGNVTLRYKDGTYFKYSATSNQIIEVCDLTKPLYDSNNKITGYALEARQFFYGQTERENPYVRVTTLDPDGLNAYQKFALTSDGQLDALLESGFLLSNAATHENVEVPGTVYDGNRITVYDRGEDPSFYIEKQYEQTAAGENRLLSYQKIQSQKDETVMTTVGIEVRYDDAQSKLTVIDRSPMPEGKPGVASYWEYKLLPGNQQGELLAVGELDTTKQDAEISRMEISDTQYTITNPMDATQLVVFERLPQGGFGRVLRYRLGEIDLEYRYGTDEKTGNETITVLNYKAGTYIKMSFLPGTAPKDSSDVIASPANVVSAGTFALAGGKTHFKELFAKKGNEWIVSDPNDSRIFDVYNSFPSDEWGGLVRSRGPPEAGATNLVDYRYEYDLTNKRATTYDLTNLQYATYDYTNPQTPKLIEQGSIEVSSQGEITKTQPAPKVEATPVLPSYKYNEAETRTFDYAYDLLSQKDVSVAVIVDHLTEADLQRLFTLNKEVGIAVLEGRIALFTSSNMSDIRLSSAVSDLISHATCIVHTVN